LKKIVFFLLILTIIFSPVNKFFISVGIRIQYSEFFSILFIVGTLFQKKLVEVNRIRLKAIRSYIYLQWIYLFPIFVSLISFVYVEKTITEFIFFLKGVSIILFFLLFLTSLLSFLEKVNFNQKKIILELFIFAVALSGIYGLLQIGFFIYFGIDFDKILSNAIPLTGNEIDISSSALGSFFRLNGFTSDPSVQASISILSLTLLMYFIFVHKIYSYIFVFTIITLCFILTMSGSGLIGMSVSFAIILISRFNKFSISGAFILILMAMPILILLYIYNEEVLFFLNHKFEKGGTTKVHAEIAQRAFNLGLDYPIFGVGFNNFSYVYQSYYGDPNYNAHNSWLNYFVELGIFGLIYKLTNSFVIIFYILRKKSSFKFYFLAGFIGLNVSSFGYETLNLFYNQALIFILLYCYSTGFFESFFASSRKTYL
jgi:hypothetical protein